MSFSKPDDLSHSRFDPLAPPIIANPYPYYAWLRLHDPLHWGMGGGNQGDAETDGCWYVTRYEDAVALLKDSRLGREIDKVLPERVTLPPDGEASAIIREWMVLRDPPWHTYLRGLAQRAFTPQMIERWTPRMESIAAALLERVSGEAQQQGFDLIEEVAVPFPVYVVAEMLGVPPSDAPLFSPWTKALAAVIEFEQTPEVASSGAAAMRELAEYLRQIIAWRRRHPQDDLISALLEFGGDTPLSENVLIGACTQLLFGGNDPVAHLIGNGLLALMRHPDEWRDLAGRGSVPASAVDELMRYDSSVQMTFRYALTEVEWRGKRIKSGDLVAIVFGSANRDGDQFAAPDILNLKRAPNRHLSLGQGIHYCLGAALARTEGRVVLDALGRMMPTLHLVQEEIHWQRTVAVRGLTALRVAR